jgi:hypothetical protein
MYKLLSKNIPNKNYPPVLYHLFYLMAAFTFCFLYHHIIVSHIDFYNNEYGAILKVLNMEAIRSIQNRILVPLIFKVLAMLFHLPDKMVFFVLMFSFTYLTFIAYYRLLCVYFENRNFNSIAALLIVYPMTWNLIAINTIFFFVDTAVIFFMVLCFYLVVTRKNYLLLLALFLGTTNHISIGFIIPVFLLFNYSRLFKKETILLVAAMVIILIGYFIVIRLMFPNLPQYKDDGLVVLSLDEAWNAIVNYKKHLLFRDLIINMGGLHIFALLFAFSGLWKKIKNEYVAVFLVVILYAIFTIIRLGIRIEEMRNFVPLIPFIIIPAMLYFSKFNPELLKLNSKIVKPEHVTNQNSKTG